LTAFNLPIKNLIFIIFMFSFAIINNSDQKRWVKYSQAGSEALTTVTMKSTIFWEVMQCSSLEVYSSGGMYCLNLILSHKWVIFTSIYTGMHGE
jgi:hypothetical protein